MLKPADIQNDINASKWSMQKDHEEYRKIDNVLITKPKPGKKSKNNRGAEEFDYSLKTDVLLEVNHDRYGVLMRDEMIVRAAEDRWNRGAAEVVRAVLAAALDQKSYLSASNIHSSVGVNQIVEHISPDSLPYLTAGLYGTSAKSLPDYVRQYLSVLAGEDVLPGSGMQFLFVAEASDPTYSVDLQAICVKLRANLMMDLVRERLGQRQARVLATVAKAHHISEQTVSPDGHARPHADIRAGPRLRYDTSQGSPNSTRRTPKALAH